MKLRVSPQKPAQKFLKLLCLSAVLIVQNSVLHSMIKAIVCNLLPSLDEFEFSTTIFFNGVLWKYFPNLLAAAPEITLTLQGAW